jgi:hypothetical protein
VGRSSSEVTIQKRDGHVAARETAGSDAAVFYRFGGSTTFALLLVGAAVVLPTQPATALPSFARQTGQPCASCHSAFPQLTPFGRRFKLGGYTLGGTRCGGSHTSEGGATKAAPSPMKVGTENSAAADDNSAAELLRQIPISGMVVPSFTHLNKGLDPADTPPGFDTNDNTFVQEASVFYGGQIYCNLGAFAQGTYERPGSVYFLDNTDIRYANNTKVGKTDLVYGLTANNNPTVQDVWNTTPAWSFPFIGASDALAPTPAASTMLEGTFEGRVLGTGAYIFANDMFYLEATNYGTFDKQTMSALGLAPEDPVSRFDGAAPYWRAAVEKDWGDYALMFGTFGMFANVAPTGNQSAPTDQVTDVGADAQFQYIHDVHALTARFSYIFEHEKLDGSQLLGLSSNRSDDLQSLKLSASYVYDSIYSFSAGYFNLRGSADTLLFSDSLSPSALGSPNSNGWVFDVAWLPFSKGGPPLWPWLNARIGLSYTLYNEFDGASTNYNGAFRDASDNNTVFAYTWIAF